MLRLLFFFTLTEKMPFDTLVSALKMERCFSVQN